MKREVAWRIFAKEYELTDTFISSEEEREPNYVITPTGARCNRIFATGVLTEVEKIKNNAVRAKLSDPTGLFTLYAGEYQKKQRDFLFEKEEPYFAAIIGKANAFKSDDGTVFTSIRPEKVSEVNDEDRVNWLITTAKRSIDRIQKLEKARESGFKGQELIEYLKNEGIRPELAKGISKAIESYEVDIKEFIDLIKEALGSFVEIEKDEFTPKDAVKKILRNSNKNEGINYSILIKKAKKKGFNEKKVEEAINELMEEGRCYEPEIGKIKIV